MGPAKLLSGSWPYLVDGDRPRRICKRTVVELLLRLALPGKREAVLRQRGQDCETCYIDVLSPTRETCLIPKLTKDGIFFLNLWPSTKSSLLFIRDRMRKK
jgi:hypothetical protein